MYVIDCQRGGVLQNQYDMVEEGVANSPDMYSNSWLIQNMDCN